MDHGSLIDLGYLLERYRLLHLAPNVSGRGAISEKQLAGDLATLGIVKRVL